MDPVESLTFKLEALQFELTKKTRELELLKADVDAKSSVGDVDSLHDVLRQLIQEVRRLQSAVALSRVSDSEQNSRLAALESSARESARGAAVSASSSRGSAWIGITTILGHVLWGLIQAAGVG